MCELLKNVHISARRKFEIIGKLKKKLIPLSICFKILIMISSVQYSKRTMIDILRQSNHCCFSKSFQRIFRLDLNLLRDYQNFKRNFEWCIFLYVYMKVSILQFVFRIKDLVKNVTDNRISNHSIPLRGCKITNIYSISFGEIFKYAL